MTILNKTKVKTNQEYFNKLGRIIYGVIENNVDQYDAVCTVVRVKNQEGKVISEHNGQLLVMLIQDLEIIK